MTLTVLSIAYPLAPVGGDATGGAEQVLTAIDAALVAARHRSIVVACEGSSVAGQLLATARVAGPFDERARNAAAERHRQAICTALGRWPVDIIHMHGVDFDRYVPPPGPTVVVTLHLPISFYPAHALRPQRPRKYFHCVSAAQRRTCPPGIALLPTIENGVPVTRLTARHAKRRFALALGRICPEKGFHIAIDAARRAGIPLLLGGAVFDYPEHRRYFDEAIAPRLGAACRFLGPLDFARKRRLLTAAHCLLVPSLVAETSSLVAMEALACGTPVVAFAAGALPAIVEHGRTGFIVADEGEMADAIRAAVTLDPEACRARARARFSLERMTGHYLGLYEKLAASGRQSHPTR
ncbi:MAG: glycosyltransferase [Alphaproteobacteria bacterium]|nr:glycosyltransferase [Alphaproteobacteria bacterium]